MRKRARVCFLKITLKANRRSRFPVFRIEFSARPAQLLIYYLICQCHRVDKKTLKINNLRVQSIWTHFARLQPAKCWQFLETETTINQFSWCFLRNFRGVGGNEKKSDKNHEVLCNRNVFMLIKSEDVVIVFYFKKVKIDLWALLPLFC